MRRNAEPEFDRVLGMAPAGADSGEAKYAHKPDQCRWDEKYSLWPQSRTYSCV